MVSRLNVGLALAGLAVLVSAGPAAAAGPARNACLAVNGVVRYEYGTATCLAGPGSLAIAAGDGAVAFAGADWVAGGTRNTAAAYGAGAHAYAGAGNGNTAIATDDATASAWGGNGNVALASGFYSYVQVMHGDHNLGIGSGDRSSVYIDGNSEHPATYNFAVASGDRASAQAGFGNRNTALASADDTYAAAQWGNFKLAVARTPGCRVENYAAAGDHARMSC